MLEEEEEDEEDEEADRSPFAPISGPLTQQLYHGGGCYCPGTDSCSFSQQLIT